MFDIHCHILPGVDDGAQFAEDSVEMLRIAAANGTDGIICTPHCGIPGAPRANYRSKSLADRFCELREGIAAAGIDVKVHMGAEIFCTPDVTELFRAQKLLTLCGSENMLIEFDFGIRGRDALSYVSALKAEGLVPIVAHPERYYFVQEDILYADRLKNAGALLQVNKGSLTGELGRDSQDAAHYLVGTRRADFVASDAHGPYYRSPSLADTHEMISELYSADYADFLLIINPLNVIKRKKALSAT